MTDTTTPEIQNQLVMQALSNPHQLFVVDRALKVDIGAFTSHITLGNKAPNGQVLAVATLTLSTETLHLLATTILESIEDQIPQIKAGHAALQKKLAKTS